MRRGVGPVFLYECLVNARRWQTYALRAVGVGALLAAMTAIALSNLPTTGNSQRDYAYLGQAYFYALVGVEMALVMLAAPAATAGSICVDRARVGTLAHLLMTDLSDSEIVLGKLSARLLPVFGLIACTWPVLAISSLLGGIDPVALILAFAIIVAVAVLGCTMALALSVWARKTHEVILATYTGFILGLLLEPIWKALWISGKVGPPPDWTMLANPFFVAFAPYFVPGQLDVWDYVGFFGVALGVSALLTRAAVWNTRPVACRGTVEQSEEPQFARLGRLIRWLPGPSLDRNPVLWREWHRTRPSRWMRILLAVLMGTTGALCLAGAIMIWKEGIRPLPGSGWQLAGTCSSMLHLVFGFLMLAAVAPTAIAEERQRGSLDILAATSLTTRSIVVGKWLGTFRLAVLIAFGPGLLALATATARTATSLPVMPGRPPLFYEGISLGLRICGVIVVIATILVHGALITSIGLALAVWIKRQSRAITLCIGLCVLILVVWPIFVFLVLPGTGVRAEGIAALSPVVASAEVLVFLSNQVRWYSGDILRWATFWAIEVLVVALGLFWLTVRTIDGCFDRIADHCWRMPVHAVVVMILAGTIGAGSLVAAIDLWAEGVYQNTYPHVLHAVTLTEVLMYTLLIALGLMLAGTVSAASLPVYATRRAAALEAGSTPPAPAGPFPLGPDRWLDADTATLPHRLILRRWWESFRLVLLLAIGPALLATALATARETPQYVARFSTDASGNRVITYVRADEGFTRAAPVLLGGRLFSVALLIATILAHGAATVSLGLALASAIERPRSVLIATIGVCLPLVLGTPMYIYMFNATRLPLFTVWGFFMIADSLLTGLVSRVSNDIMAISHWVAVWDLVVTVLSIGLVWFTIRAWQRRLLGPSKDEATPGSGGDEKPRAVEAAVIGD